MRARVTVKKQDRRPRAASLGPTAMLQTEQPTADSSTPRNLVSRLLAGEERARSGQRSAAGSAAAARNDGRQS
jgi:hypothetical protein